jgi:hypothetical protein
MQTRVRTVFYKEATKSQINHYRFNNLCYLYNKNKLVSENNVDVNTKESAKKMGFASWENVPTLATRSWIL